MNNSIRKTVLNGNGYNAKHLLKNQPIIPFKNHKFLIFSLHRSVKILKPDTWTIHFIYVRKIFGENCGLNRNLVTYIKSEKKKTRRLYTYAILSLFFHSKITYTHIYWCFKKSTHIRARKVETSTRKNICLAMFIEPEQTANLINNWSFGRGRSEALVLIQSDVTWVVFFFFCAKYLDQVKKVNFSESNLTLDFLFSFFFIKFTLRWKS